ncbi:MAG: GNAT family N-acetyltransferase [Firmicutes bacterium]|nr:GNAT family N-acetyltransferase [Bacillota bacterium]
MKRVRLQSGQELTIRQAIPADAEEILAYIEQISAETDYLTFGPGEFGITAEQEGIFIDTLTKSDNKLMILAFLENKLVGHLTFMGGSRPRTRHAGELGVSVLRNYWRLGIGTKLIRCCLDWANKAGIRKVNLRVRSDNTGARHLYEKLGFVYEGKTTREFCLDGKFYDVIHMGIEID